MSWGMSWGRSWGRPWGRTQHTGGTGALYTIMILLHFSDSSLQSYGLNHGGTGPKPRALHFFDGPF
jgi:hypothetical protein